MTLYVALNSLQIIAYSSMGSVGILVYGIFLNYPVSRVASTLEINIIKEGKLASIRI